MLFSDIAASLHVGKGQGRPDRRHAQRVLPQAWSTSCSLNGTWTSTSATSDDRSVWRAGGAGCCLARRAVRHRHAGRLRDNPDPSHKGPGADSRRHRHLTGAVVQRHDRIVHDAILPSSGTRWNRRAVALAQPKPGSSSARRRSRRFANRSEMKSRCQPPGEGQRPRRCASTASSAAGRSQRIFTKEMTRPGKARDRLVACAPPPVAVVLAALLSVTVACRGHRLPRRHLATATARSIC